MREHRTRSWEQERRKTLRGVAAAEAAAKQGAEIFLRLIALTSDEDVCATQRLWIKSIRNLRQNWANQFTERHPAKNGYSLVRPMDVKRKLDEALLNKKVPYLYGSYLTEILHDPNGEVAGIVVANRSGRQAIRGKVIIDASDRALAARRAGAEFTPPQRDLKSLSV